MAVSEGDLAFVLDQLAGLGELRPPGCSAASAYCGDAFFGLIDDGVLYLKVDDTTRARYTRRRLKPFAPGGIPGCRLPGAGVDPRRRRHAGGLGARGGRGRPSGREAALDAPLSCEPLAVAGLASSTSRTFRSSVVPVYGFGRNWIVARLPGERVLGVSRRVEDARAPAFLAQASDQRRSAHAGHHDVGQQVRTGVTARRKWVSASSPFDAASTV